MSKRKPVMVMVTQGRRAFGEDWRQVAVYPTAEGGYEVENEPTEGPADGRPIYVPALGNASIEMAEWIIGYQKQEAEYRKTHNLVAPPPDTAELNRMWHDYIEEKLRWFKRQSTSGPAMTCQRD